MASNLVKPFAAGQLNLSNRVVHCALTRLRMSPGVEAPREMNCVYYEQRSSAGLILSECMAIDATARGYVRAPGMYKPEQIKAWKTVVQRVKQGGGATFFAQLFHPGRVTHSSLIGGQLPVAPSALPMAGQLYVEGGVKMDYETPKVLEVSEIPAIVANFVQAAKNALEAGFDGVEVHCGNGYLLQQFLAKKTNQRQDTYGGSVANRARLLLEVLDAIAAEIGSGKTAVKIQPGVTFSDLVEPEEDILETLAYLAKELAARKLAFVELSSLNGAPYFQFAGLPAPNVNSDVYRHFRASGYNGTLVINGGLTPDSAGAYVADGVADMASFGCAFIANANLPELIAAGAELNMAGANPAVWYATDPAIDEKGYIDWPLVKA